MVLSLYLHIPFCVKKCRYCDFYSLPLADERARVPLFIDGIIEEIKLYSLLLQAPERTIETLYIGGGTPTCLADADLVRVFAAVQKSFNWPADGEITVEANPGTLNQEKLTLLKEAGVNRISLGVQSFLPEELSLLGRIHGPLEVTEAVGLLREAGFSNLNLDLIYGLPGQKVSDWQYNLEQAIKLNPEHISVYGLILEEGTPLARMVDEGELQPCREETAVAMHELTCSLLAEAGYVHYEIANFAKPGKESRHNLTYWHNREYLGVGPGAHSYLHGRRFSNYRDLSAYLTILRDGRLPIADSHLSLPHEAMGDMMFLGLRLTDGIDLSEFHRRFGIDPLLFYQSQIAHYQKMRLLEINGTRLRLTAKGLLLANEVFQGFV